MASLLYEAGYEAAAANVLAYLRDCLNVTLGSGSRSDFNQGVIRGLEIAVAQVEGGHWRPASADTHPKDGDALAAPLVSGAVPHEDEADAQTAHPIQPRERK